MSVFSRQGLIAELLDRTELIKAGTQPFLRLTTDQLTRTPAPGKWSIVEVFGHLNLSNDIYIRSILSRITRATDTKSDEYRGSWIGDWAYEKIMPRPDGTVLKMRAAKSIRPVQPEEEDVRTVIESFQRKCDALDDILRHAATKDLQRIRIPFHFIPLVHFGLGDILRFTVAHNERHLLQAQRITAPLSSQ
jgi:DinB superfamily